MSENLHIQEDYVEVLENGTCLGYGSSDVYETFTNNIGKLFTSLQKDHGRCKGKVYIDTSEVSRQVGWVFEKKKKYTDCNESFIRQVWVTLHEQPETHTIEYHYQYLD